jgi:hypothetical protein
VLEFIAQNDIHLRDEMIRKVFSTNRSLSRFRQLKDLTKSRDNSKILIQCFLNDPCIKTHILVEIMFISYLNNH